MIEKDYFLFVMHNFLEFREWLWSIGTSVHFCWRFPEKKPYILLPLLMKDTQSIRNISCSWTAEGWANPFNLNWWEFDYTRIWGKSKWLIAWVYLWNYLEINWREKILRKELENSWKNFYSIAYWKFLQIASQIVLKES